MSFPPFPELLPSSLPPPLPFCAVPLPGLPAETPVIVCVGVTGGLEGSVVVVVVFVVVVVAGVVVTVELLGAVASAVAA